MTGKEIKLLRKKAKLTQVAFAAKLGVSFKAVNFWENGHATPSKMAEILLKKFMEENNISLKKGE